MIDRTRNLNTVIAPYLDRSGAPTTWTETLPPLLKRIPDPSARPLRISSADGSTAWDLDITRDPANRSSFVGPPPPMPTSGGRVVYFDQIGPDPDGGDFGPSTMPVIAVLEPDGTGRWIRLPDGWTVAASRRFRSGP